MPIRWRSSGDEALTLEAKVHGADHMRALPAALRAGRCHPTRIAASAHLPIPGPAHGNPPRLIDHVR